MTDLHNLLGKLAALDEDRLALLAEIRAAREAVAADLAAADAALGPAPPARKKHPPPAARNGPAEPPAPDLVAARNGLVEPVLDRAEVARLGIRAVAARFGIEGVMPLPRPELLPGQTGPHVVEQRMRVMARDARDGGNTEVAEVLADHADQLAAGGALAAEKAKEERSDRSRRAAETVRKRKAEQAAAAAAELPEASLYDAAYGGPAYRAQQKAEAAAAAAVPAEIQSGAAFAAAIDAAAERHRQPSTVRIEKPVPMVRAMERPGNTWTNDALIAAGKFCGCDPSDLIQCNRCDRARYRLTHPCPCGSAEYRLPGTVGPAAARKAKPKKGRTADVPTHV